VSQADALRSILESVDRVGRIREQRVASYRGEVARTAIAGRRRRWSVRGPILVDERPFPVGAHHRSDVVARVNSLVALWAVPPSGGSSSSHAAAIMSQVATPSLDQALRHRVYSALARGDRAPGASSLAAALGVVVAEVREGLERLHAAHALVLDAVTREVRMALPFSSIPTAYRVESGRRSWEVNCAWDSLALVRLLDLQAARIVDQGGPGREPRVLTVVSGDLVERDGVISSPRPAWRWWDDIVFT
jgi:hypothetical protein